MSELGLSYRRAAAQSGGKVSHGTLNTIATGRHSWRVDDSTIAGIALALDVPEDVVRAAVGRAQRAPDTEFVLPKRASRLSAQERRAVLSMVDALLTAAEKSHASARVDGAD
jgi:transcriptional regulator with XRE-family HTH domain